MLSRIGLSNFKCFDKLDLRCAPLNLLCGLNGTGKSSVIQALLLLRQSVESRHLRVGRLALSGDRADVGTGADVLFEPAVEETVSFTVAHKSVPSVWSRQFAYSRDDAELEMVDAKDPLPSAWRTHAPFGGPMVHVSASRPGPLKWFRLSEAHGRRGEFGRSAEHAWSVLVATQDRQLSRNDPRLGANGRFGRLRDVLDHWLQHVSPGAKLEFDVVRATDAIVPGFTFDRAKDVRSRRYRATNVGFGLSYVFPVVWGLLVIPGTLCLIENPEAHLHPRGQTKLAELAVRAAVAGVQVFAETHSDHFVDGVRIAVRDGLIKPEHVAFHYFERDGLHATVTSPTIDADGRLSHWPPGFFDEQETNLAKLLAPRK